MNDRTDRTHADRTHAASRAGWTLSPALAGAVVVGVVGVLAAFLMSRVEPALVGAPLLLAAALSWDRRPRRDATAASGASGAPNVADAMNAPGASGAPSVADAANAPGASGAPRVVDAANAPGASGAPSVADAVDAANAPGAPDTARTADAADAADAADDVLTETAVRSAGPAHPAPDGSAAMTVSIHAGATQRPDALQLRLALGGSAPVDAVLTPRAAARTSGEVPIVHSGPQRVAAVAARAIGADAAWVGTPGAEASVERVVRPRRVPLRRLPLPARLLGLTGQHVSTRPGDGGEFRDIDLFHPGDRLRRIDWRATARAGRAGELYVRRTTATSDAAVHLVLDARDDLTGVVADWSRAHPRPAVSSLDLAREAAASLAVAYAAVGDRVGFDDLGESRRVLPPRAGARHRERVLRDVELTTATGTTFQRVRSPRLSPGAIVYVLSTFLDDQPVALALGWRASGHRVVTVDVLPARDARDLTARERLALRTVELERRLRLRRLQAGGVELLTWQDPVAREAGLRALTSGRRG